MTLIIIAEGVAILILLVLLYSCRRTGARLKKEIVALKKVIAENVEAMNRKTIMTSRDEAILAEHAKRQRNRDNYLENIKAKCEQRKKSCASGGTKEAIPVAVSQTYMDAFENANENHYGGLVIDELALDFFKTYLEEHTGAKLAVALAKFDKSLLSIRNLSDPLLDEFSERDTKYTILFGIKNSGTDPIQPFVVSGYDNFYDDWNDVWP